MANKFECYYGVFMTNEHNSNEIGKKNPELDTEALEAANHFPKEL